ncbi:hypothetical protein COV49_00480 [Candidatus Falkowbacteria bacterium CG11_big_fil_rev_8_21_14_0_20_39_10]|uniref:Nudix hydrolase domain-containing protein n=1 Tax=Candidatus Falkowbacteria bacterium CG11_big_fil_rev_8_21_14_0_20_39_10 TaxID=1974570 RepID=A0A2M6KAA4_9BACT|nr:MAG: hypothetical protein COV49_00480 [Candidatus Falkowbacteria bacterium CG11_big_fil_rev_8_21_14_0_20_39_10]
MGKKNRTVLVAKIEDIFQSIGRFSGYMHFDDSQEAIRAVSAIERRSFWMSEDKAEKMENIRELIGYVLIVNPKTKKVFVYQRAGKKSDYKETRLQGKWSCGIGGHIEMEDFDNKGEAQKIFQGTLLEIWGETDCHTNYFQPIAIGFISVDTKRVDQDHFGVVYLQYTTQRKLTIKKEIQQGRFFSFSEFEKLVKDSKQSPSVVSVETWSKLCLKPLANILC